MSYTPEPARLMLNQPSQRTDEHFDYLIHRPAEREACVSDDVRFDLEGCRRVVGQLVPHGQPQS